MGTIPADAICRPIHKGAQRQNLGLCVSLIVHKPQCKSSPLCSVSSANRVCWTINQDARHLRILDGAHPAPLALQPLCHVLDQPAMHVNVLTGVGRAGRSPQRSVRHLCPDHSSMHGTPLQTGRLQGWLQRDYNNRPHQCRLCYARDIAELNHSVPHILCEPFP